MLKPPEFDSEFREKLCDLFRWRRDVRRFRSDPVDRALIDGLIAQACLAPSVGNCQPWRFVKVDDPDRRRMVRDSFERSNADALGHYEGERAALYARLKLAGLDKAPIQIAVFADTGTGLGQGLGRRTMPQTLQYSAVAAVNILWLAARAHGIGVGWISILEPDVVTRAMEVPDHWELIAYLCVGYPEEEHPEPELERYGWQERLDIDQFVFYR